MSQENFLNDMPCVCSSPGCLNGIVFKTGEVTVSLFFCLNLHEVYRGLHAKRDSDMWDIFKKGEAGQ